MISAERRIRSSRSFGILNGFFLSRIRTDGAQRPCLAQQDSSRAVQRRLSPVWGTQPRSHHGWRICVGGRRPATSCGCSARLPRSPSTGSSSRSPAARLRSLRRRRTRRQGGSRSSALSSAYCREAHRRDRQGHAHALRHCYASLLVRYGESVSCVGRFRPRPRGRNARHLQPPVGRRRRPDAGSRGLGSAESRGFCGFIADGTTG